MLETTRAQTKTALAARVALRRTNTLPPQSAVTVQQVTKFDRGATNPPLRSGGKTPEPAPAAERSGVAADEQDAPQDQGGGGVGAEDPEPRPRAQLVYSGEAAVPVAEDGLTGVGREPLLDGVLPRQGKGGDYARQHQQQAEQRGYGSGGVADHGADPQGEEAQHGEVQAAADHRSEHPGVAQVSLDVARRQ